MSAVSGFTSREYVGESDLGPIAELLNRIDAVDRLDDNYSAEDLRSEYEEPGFDPARDMRLWEDSSGRLVGYGQMWIPRETEVADGFLYWRVAPETRHTGIEDEIFEWGERRMREVREETGRPAVLRGNHRDHYTYAREQLQHRGFVPVRYYYVMERSLSEPIPDPRFPEGFSLRHAQGEDDIAPWVEMYNLSFIDHYNFHPRTVEHHAYWLQSPKYAPERDLIGIAPDGTFAGFCFCWIDAGDNERNKRKDGWIELLGTRRGFRGIGLGRAMLLAGLQLLKAEGMSTAVLAVDAENPTGGLRLYESVGFTIRHSDTSYRKEIE